MKNILLPTDFSDNAWSASIYALQLYAKEKCTFYFLHATNIEATTPKVDLKSIYIEATKDKVRQELLGLKKIARVTNANANHKFEIILSDKNLKTAINETILNQDIELVVMGTKGVSSKIEAFFGSNTVNIINKIKDCPILIVPDKYEFVIPKEIAFPSDFNRQYNNKELQPLLDLTKLYDSNINVVHINTELNLSDNQKNNRSILNKYLQKYSHNFHWLPNYTKKASAIINFIEDSNINLLAMLNYKHSLIEKITHEPVIKKIGFHPTVPFLIIPA